MADMQDTNTTNFGLDSLEQQQTPTPQATQSNPLNDRFATNFPQATLNRPTTSPLEAMKAQADVKKAPEGTKFEYFRKSLPYMEGIDRKWEESKQGLGTEADTSGDYNPTQEDFEKNISFINGDGTRMTIPEDYHTYILGSKTNAQAQFRINRVREYVELERQTAKSGTATLVGLNAGGMVLDPLNYMGGAGAFSVLNKADRVARVTQLAALAGRIKEAGTAVKAAKTAEDVAAAEALVRKGGTAITGLSRAERFGVAASANMTTSVASTLIDEQLHGREATPTQVALSAAIGGAVGGLTDMGISRLSRVASTKTADDLVKAFDTDRAAKLLELKPAEVNTALHGAPEEIVQPVQKSLFDAPVVKSVTDVVQSAAQRMGKLFGDAKAEVVGKTAKNGKDSVARNIRLENGIDFTAYQLSKPLAAEEREFFESILDEALPQLSRKGVSGAELESRIALRKQLVNEVRTSVDDATKGVHKTKGDLTLDPVWNRTHDVPVLDKEGKHLADEAGNPLFRAEPRFLKNVTKPDPQTFEKVKAELDDVSPTVVHTTPEAHAKAYDADLEKLRVRQEEGTPMDLFDPKDVETINKKGLDIEPTQVMAAVKERISNVPFRDADQFNREIKTVLDDVNVRAGGMSPMQLAMSKALAAKRAKLAKPVTDEADKATQLLADVKRSLAHDSEHLTPAELLTKQNEIDMAWSQLDASHEADLNAAFEAMEKAAAESTETVTRPHDITLEDVERATKPIELKPTADVPEYAHEAVTKDLMEASMMYKKQPVVFASDVDKALYILLNSKHRLFDQAKALMDKVFPGIELKEILDQAEILRGQDMLKAFNESEDGVTRVDRFWHLMEREPVETRIEEVEMVPIEMPKVEAPKVEPEAPKVHTKEPKVEAPKVDEPATSITAGDKAFHIVYRNGKGEDISFEHLVRRRGREATAVATKRELDVHVRALSVRSDEAAANKLEEEIAQTTEALGAFEARGAKLTKTEKELVEYLKRRQEHLTTVEDLSFKSAKYLEAQIKGLKGSLDDSLQDIKKLVDELSDPDKVDVTDVVRTADGAMDIAATEMKAVEKAAADAGFEKVAAKVAGGVALATGTGAASASDGKDADPMDTLLVTTGLAVGLYGGAKFIRKVKLSQKTSPGLKKTADKVSKLARFDRNFLMSISNNPVAVKFADLFTGGAGTKTGLDATKDVAYGSFFRTFHKSFNEGLANFAKTRSTLRARIGTMSNWQEYAELVTLHKAGVLKDAPAGVAEASTAMQKQMQRALDEARDLHESLKKVPGYDAENSVLNNWFFPDDGNYVHLQNNFDKLNRLKEDLARGGHNPQEVLETLFQHALMTGPEKYSPELSLRLARAKLKAMEFQQANVEISRMSLADVATFRRNLEGSGQFSAQEIDDLIELSPLARRTDSGTGVAKRRLPWGVDTSIEVPGFGKLSFMDLHETDAFAWSTTWFQQITGDIARARKALLQHQETGVFEDVTHKDYFSQVKAGIVQHHAGDPAELSNMVDALENHLYGRAVGTPSKSRWVEAVAKTLENNVLFQTIGKFGLSGAFDNFLLMATFPRAALMQMGTVRKLVGDTRNGVLNAQYLRELEEEFGVGMNGLRHYAYHQNGEALTFLKDLANGRDAMANVPEWAADKLQNGVQRAAAAGGVNWVTESGAHLASRTYHQKLLDWFRKPGALTDDWKGYLSEFGLEGKMLDRVLDLFSEAEHTPGGRLLAMNTDKMYAKDPAAFTALQQFTYRMAKKSVGELQFGQVPAFAQESVFGRMMFSLMSATYSSWINNAALLVHKPFNTVVAFMAAASVMLGLVHSLTAIVLSSGGNQEELDKQLTPSNLALQAINKSSFSGFMPTYISAGAALTGYNDPFAVSRNRGQGWGIASVQAANNTVKAMGSIAGTLKEDDELTQQELKNIFRVFGFNSLVLPASVEQLADTLPKK